MMLDYCRTLHRENGSENRRGMKSKVNDGRAGGQVQVRADEEQVFVQILEQEIENIVEHMIYSIVVQVDSHIVG